MKKVICLLFLIFLSKATFAHPLDISHTYMTLFWNRAIVTTLFHTYQIEYLLWQNKISTNNVSEYINHKDIIKKYVENNIYFKWCYLTNFDIKIQEEYQIIDRWLEVNYDFICKSHISKWDIEINFFNNFELQTNKLGIYDWNNWQLNSILYKNIILNNSYNITQFDLNQQAIKDNDTDWDGISDIEEKHYWTNINNIDTDWDNRSDYEEIASSYNPLNKSLWPSQKMREKLEISYTNKNSNIQKEKNETQNLFSDILKKISNYVKNINNENIIYILFLTVLLGFIHAMWPWHSKSILIWYVVDKNKSFMDSIIYAIIFTITHLIDIIIIFIIAKVFFSYYDISNYIIYIQRVSIIILIFLSIYIIFIAYMWIKLKNNNISYYKNIKSKYLMWFLSWLAPCTFWWSIFLLLFSLWSIHLIPIFILALWVWIFICLIMIIIITYIVREKIFNKIKLFSRYSSLISWIIILNSSIYILYTLF